jgi:putative hydroxymethylpyrimidine transport system substrate-binding protein
LTLDFPEEKQPVPIRCLVLIATILVAAGRPAAAEKLTVLLDWFVNPDHAPLFVAQEKGYFKDAGLEVELVAPADPNDPPKLVAAKQGDIALSYQPQLHLQIAAGLPLARIGTLIATPLVTVVALADGPVKTMADLKGRKVGFSVAGSEDTLLKTMLKKNGVKAEDTTFVNVNFALVQALLSNQVDAVIGAYRNFELNQLAIEKRPGRAFYPEEEGVPAFDELIFLARNDRLGDPALRKFVDAVERGTLFLINHPDESWELFIRGHKDLDDELNRRAWRDTLARFAHSPAALDSRRYERFARFLNESGLIPAPPPLATYAVELK